MVFDEPEKVTGPKGFDPLACGSEDRRDILTTLRAHVMFKEPLLYQSNETVMNPGIVQCKRMLQTLRQAFCKHKQSFAYRKYDDFVFVEFSNCSRCGKTLGKFSGFDEDMRG